MKLQAQSSKALRDALQKALKCISPKNALAILDYVLLSATDKNSFFFTSGTSDSQLILSAPLSIVEGEMAHPVALPPVTLAAFLSTLPECTCTLTFNDDKTFLLEYCTIVNGHSKRGEVTMPYLSGEEYPRMTDFGNDATKIELPMSVFGLALNNGGEFVNRKDEFRPVLASLCFDIAEDRSELVIAASNGHTLFKHVHPNDPKKGGSDFFRSGEPRQMLIHSRDFKPLSVFSECEAIQMECDGHFNRYTSGDIIYISKTVEGKYPNYNSVIPRNNPFFVCFSKREMTEILKRVSIFCSKASNLVVVKKEGLFLTVKAEDAYFGTEAADQVLITNGECEEGMLIGFSYTNLLTALTAIEGDNIRMALIDPAHPAVITADVSAPYTLTLCMPMVIND